MSRWLRAGVICCATGLASTSALAGDGDRWAGPYVGVNFGYGAADVGGGLSVLPPDTNVPYPTGPLGYSVDPEGAFGGLQLGINGPSGPFFSGIELDIQTADIAGTSRTDITPANIYAFNYRATTSIDWFATLRARLGIATSDTLFYVTGGLAIAQVNYDATYLITDARGPGGFANLKSEASQVGYVLGAGFEHALGRNWSVKLEYQYLNLGNQEAEGGLHFASGAPSNEKVTSDFSTELHTLRLGLNFRLQ